MKLLSLTAKSYRSLRDVSIEFDDLNLFIGANASGKSTVLDALRFLRDGVQSRDFGRAVNSRGGFLNLAWKGEYAQEVALAVQVEDESSRFEWSVRLVKQGQGVDFEVYEQVQKFPLKDPPQELLKSEKGEGEWWSGKKKAGVTLRQTPTICALASASADASFPAREVAEFVSRWGFFDPSPFLLRRDWHGGSDSGQFDSYGRNLGETLYALKTSSPEIFKRIISATREVVGIPDNIEPKQAEDRFFFVQKEPGLQFTVNQMGVSSGTLRMLALMTALYGNQRIDLVGVEEPENYIHPSALSSFVRHLRNAVGRVQFIVTTHSPLLLDFLDDPSAVRVVQRGVQGGTLVFKEQSPDDVRKALDESGFGLGEYHQTKGFGG